MSARDINTRVFLLTRDQTVTDELLYVAYSTGRAYGQAFEISHDASGYGLVIY